MSGGVAGLSEDLILARMVRYLRARREHPAGSPLWAQATAGFAECQAELDRRTRAQVLCVVQEQRELLRDTLALLARADDMTPEEALAAVKGLQERQQRLTR